MSFARAATSGFLLALALGVGHAVTATPALAQEPQYRCCNVPKQDWLPGIYTVAKCTAMPDHEPETQDYDGWKQCIKARRGSPPPPPEEGDPPKEGRTQ